MAARTPPDNDPNPPPKLKRRLIRMLGIVGIIIILILLALAMLGAAFLTSLSLFGVAPNELEKGRSGRFILMAIIFSGWAIWTLVSSIILKYPAKIIRTSQTLCAVLASLVALSLIISDAAQETSFNNRAADNMPAYLIEVDKGLPPGTLTTTDIVKAAEKEGFDPSVDDSEIDSYLDGSFPNPKGDCCVFPQLIFLEERDGLRIVVYVHQTYAKAYERVARKVYGPTVSDMPEKVGLDAPFIYSPCESLRDDSAADSPRPARNGEYLYKNVEIQYDGPVGECSQGTQELKELAAFVSLLADIPVKS